MTYHIENLATYARDYEYIVARECNGAYWFWGAWHEEDRAYAAARDIGGRVFRRETVEG